MRLDLGLRIRRQDFKWSVSSGEEQPACHRGFMLGGCWGRGRLAHGVRSDLEGGGSQKKKKSEKK